MAGPNQERYWRIYLLLHEGSPLISKQLIAREIEKCGGDLGSLLFENKAKLCENLSELDANILFPENHKTDIDKWNAGLFPCVILTLFSKTLQQVEKQLIKRVQNSQNDFKELPAMSLDYDAYEDLEQTLSKTLQKLAVVVSDEREMVTKIDELLLVYLKQPLNVANLLGKIRKFNMPKETRHELKVFLEAHARNELTSGRTPDAQTSVMKEEGSIDEYGHSRKSANASVETHIDLDGTDKLEEAARGSDAWYSECEEVTTLVSKDVSRIKVQNVEGGHTDQQVEHPRRSDYQDTDFWKNFSDADIDSSIQEDLENMKVKIAMLGRTGVGKSLFINVIRGCTSKKDPFYADVGPIETTYKAGCYPHPKNKHLIFYDLPGIGTANFKRKTFLNDERINFYSYDIYIIMASDRFTEDETFFAEALKKSGKMFMFVRSRVDIHLDDKDGEEAVIDQIRADCEKKLRGLPIKETDVYLISSKQLDHKLLDFDRLVERLVCCLSGMKNEVMLFSLQFNTKKIIDDKEKALESRISRVCMTSAVVGVIPIRGVSQLFDFVSVKWELGFYRNTLGVTVNNLKDLAEIKQTTVDELKRQYKIKSFDIYKDRDNTKAGVQFADIFKQHALTDAPKCTVTTEHTLKSNLKIIVEDARKMMDILLKETGMKISEVK